jgi:hypothetical protein
MNEVLNILDAMGIKGFIQGKAPHFRVLSLEINFLYLGKLVLVMGG